MGARERVGKLVQIEQLFHFRTAEHEHHGRRYLPRARPRASSATTVPARQRQRGLEAGASDSGAARLDLPGGDVRGAVPARVHRRPAPDGDRRVARPPSPGEAERAVVLAAVRQRRVELHGAAFRELREVRIGAPADEDVAVPEQLHAAELVCVQRGSVDVLVLERRAHALRVQPEDDPARARYAVVEDREDAPALVAARVVLQREVRAGAEREVAPLTAEPPQHRSRLPVHLVHRPRVARGDDQVPVRVDVDRVDMEIVPRIADRRVRLADGNVVEAAPLEEHPRTRHLELLHDAAHGQPARAAMPNLEARHERCASIGEQQLVQVGRPAVPGREARDLAIGRVGDDVHAVTEAAARQRLPPREHGLAVQRLRAEVHRGKSRGLEPHRPAGVVEDERAALARPRRRREEQKTRSRPRRGLQDRHRRRIEVRPRDEARRHANRRGEREGGAAGEELRPREPRQRCDTAATGAFGSG